LRPGTGTARGEFDGMSGNGTVYHEALTSHRTTALFATLAILFLALFAWRFTGGGFGPWAIVWLCLAGVFLFYTVNYRSLSIRISAAEVNLAFGIFRTTLRVEHIASWSVDRASLWRISGAGIHFTFIAKRYRMYLNFLEHPRIVLALRQRKGPVREVAFSTRAPGAVMQALVTVCPATTTPVQ
jgi:hypothetical protein